MSATEDRLALMVAAAELQATLREHNKQVNRIVNQLLGEADKLLIASADEKQAGMGVTKKNVSYNKQDAVVSSHAPMITTGKRKCGICHKAGHNKQTCPDAHLKFDADRGKKTKVKK